MRAVWTRLWGIGAMLVGSTASAATINLTYRFPLDPMDPASGAELSALRRELHPVVPVRLARILLPAGEELAHIEVVTDQAMELSYEPEIAGAQVPLCHVMAPQRKIDSWDERAPYPKAFYDEPITRELRGHHIVELPIYPLRILGNGRAERIREARVTVVTRPYFAPAQHWRANTRDRVEANFRVDNPEPVATAAHESEGYLILGPRSLIGTTDDTPLQALISEKKSRGLNVEMVDLESAVTSPSPAAIRDFIRQRYQRGGIDYVLLVGDHANLAWMKIPYPRGATETVPSDQYYACLDGDFTGQPDKFDWACEVGVGRVGARSRQDVANWVEKTLQLQSFIREGQTRRHMIFGEKLDNQTLASWGLEYLVTGRDSAPRSVGFPPSTEVIRLYETFARQHWAGEVIAAFNESQPHVINHAGHANATSVMRIPASLIPDLRNRPSFIYTQGCYPNDPDHDNWTIQAVRAPSYGPAAMIANTRYGFYEQGRNGEGKSMKLQRTFWSTRFADGIKTISRMNHRAKEIYVGIERGSLTAYTALESNLIGDPELDLGIE